MKYILSLVTLIILFSFTKKKPETSTEPLNTKVAAIQQSELQKSMARGKDVYTDFCITCHTGTGKGVENTYPPLAGSDWLKNKPVEETIKAVKYGLSGTVKVNGKTFNSAMMPMGLSDEEIADVLNYVMNTWGNKQKKMITPNQVAGVKKE